MTNTFLPDLDREELDRLLRGFQVSRMLMLVADLWGGDKVRTDGHITLPNSSLRHGIVNRDTRRLTKPDTGH
jgi:hypothetical protein